MAEFVRGHYKIPLTYVAPVRETHSIAMCTSHMAYIAENRGIVDRKDLRYNPIGHIRTRSLFMILA